MPELRRDASFKIPERRGWSPDQIIGIRPFLNGWKVFEAPGVEPVFLSKEQAIDYAECRACFRTREIRVPDSSEPLRALFHSMKWIEGLIGLLDDQTHSLAT
jgi:hypothetical protein